MDEQEMMMQAQARRKRRQRNEEVHVPVPDSDPSWDQVGMGFVENFPRSTLNVIKDTVAPLADPWGTAKGIGRLAAGGVEKLIPGEQGHEKYADAAGQFFADRYGSVAGLKRTLRDDPAGFLADASVPLTLGGAAAARAPGVVGKVGRAAQIAGKVEPIVGTGKVVKTIGGAIPHVLGISTGVGKTPISTAYNAGKKGGTAAKKLADDMREGGSPAAMLEVVEEAQAGIGKAYQGRGQRYRQGMSGIGALPAKAGAFASIEKAALKSLNQSIFKGKDFSPTTRGLREKIFNTVEDWKNRDPKEFHTPEALDKMKREIGELRDGETFGTPGFKAADDVYKTISKEIETQFPEYADFMADYAKTTKNLSDMQRTLSLGHKATPDTALRKLQSGMRDNVNTSYGGRMSLIDDLENYAPNIRERLAGQALSSPIPRGLSKYMGLGQLGTIATNAIANPLAAAIGVATLPALSPRLVGEAALATGRVAGAAGKYTPKAVREAAPHVPKVLHGSRYMGILGDLKPEEEEDLLGPVHVVQ